MDDANDSMFIIDSVGEANTSVKNEMQPDNSLSSEINGDENKDAEEGDGVLKTTSGIYFP